MFYEDIEDHSPEHFHRATGVSKALFSEMLSTLEAAKPRMGRPPKLTLANQLVVCLMYLREYRTQFHIAQTYRVSEPTVHRIIVKVEDTLMASGKYTLPSKRTLSGDESRYELVLVDATETPCERPKKAAQPVRCCCWAKTTKETSTAAKRNVVFDRAAPPGPVRIP